MHNDLDPKTYLYNLEYCYPNHYRNIEFVSNLILPSQIKQWTEMMRIAGFQYHVVLFGDNDDANF